MSMRLTCPGCTSTSTTRANAAAKNRNGPKSQFTGQRQDMQLKCNTCETIEAVIEKLRVLVLRYPFLETEGRAYADRLAKWEYGDDLIKSTSGDSCTASTKDDDISLRMRLKEMGLDDVSGLENVWEGEGVGWTPVEKKNATKVHENWVDQQHLDETHEDCAEVDGRIELDMQRSAGSGKSG